MASHQQTQRGIAILTGTASAVLIAVSISILGLIFWPVFANYIPESPQPVYKPQLPLSDERTYTFVRREQTRSLYPALPAPETDHSEAGNWIRIPSIDVQVPLVLSSSMKDKDVLATLSEGAALYPNGVLPGQLGNVFIAAHSTGEPWKGKYRFAFLKINEVEPGHFIHLDWNGTRYTYTITGSDIVTPSPDFKISSSRPVPTVMLMACWPLWTTDKRMLLKAELTNVTQLTPASI